MGRYTDPAAFTNAFNTQVQMGQQARESEQINAFRQQQMKMQQDENAFNQQERERVAKERDATMQREAFPRIGELASQISGIQDPAQKRAAFRNALTTNAQLFGAVGMPVDQTALAKLDALDDAGIQATLSGLVRFAPQAGPTKLAAGESLVGQNADGTYEARFTAPAKAAGQDGFTLSPGQVRYGADGKPIATAPGKDPSDPSFTQENSLRDEHDKQTAQYVDLKTSFETIKTLGQNGSPAGDIAMVAAFMRAVDPGSRVTGAEQATAENAGGVPAVVRGYYNKLLGTGQLSESQRQDFIKQAGNLVDARGVAYKATRKKFEGLAKRYNLNPANIVGDDLSAAAAPQAPAPTQQQAPPAAIDYLRQHPEAAPQFKAKYGYLP